MADSHIAVRNMRGIQQALPLSTLTPQLAPLEPKGVVYTKHWVVELMLDLAGYSSSANLVNLVAVEPSAGEGAFLGQMIERLVDSCQRLRLPIEECAGSLIAYELEELSAQRARTLAARILQSRGVSVAAAKNLAQTWVRTGDYLFDSMNVNADFVIGNPPYVRLEEIPEATAMLYRSAYTTMRGRADLYVAFFEAALRQLKTGGTCAFICADRWMRNQYGAELRELITSAFSVDVVLEMHNADAFQNEVDAYPAITVIRHREQGRTVVASARPEVECTPSSTLALSLLAGEHDKRGSLPNGLRAAHVGTWFNGDDPWPCRSPEQLALLRRLEDKYPSLEANARVGIGVATGNDSVFITKDASLVESSRLLKLAIAKDIRSGKMEWSGHYLVNPWNCDGIVKLDDYPRLRNYFEAHGTELKKRHTAIKSANAWFKTIDRVTHALTEKQKLYIADIKDVLNPVLDRGGTYPHHNLYFIESDAWDLEVLGGILMSAVGHFFVSSYGVRMRGGYFRFQAQYLRRIRVPPSNNLSDAQSEELRQAFRARDRHRATSAALGVYQIDAQELETALEY